MNFPRRSGKALEDLVFPSHTKKATANQGLIKVNKTDGITHYGLWHRNTFSNEPIFLIFLTESRSMTLTELESNPSVHSYTLYQLRDLELQRIFQKSIIDRYLHDKVELFSLLEPLVHSGKYTGDRYLKLIAYLSVIKPGNSTNLHQSLSETSNSEDYAKIIDKNLEAVEKLLAGSDCSVKLKPQVASNELEEILFERVVL
jgi:hypothetical protein